MTTEPTTPKQKRGFALLTPEQRKIIASKGGRSVPAALRTFSTSKSKAVEAGRKGGAGRAKALWVAKAHLLKTEG